MQGYGYPNLNRGFCLLYDSDSKLILISTPRAWATQLVVPDHSLGLQQLTPVVNYNLLAEKECS